MTDPETTDQANTDGKPKAPDWIFENIAEASKLAKRVYLAYVWAVLYVIVTAATIADREMLFNEGHVKGARVYTPFGNYIAISMPKQFKAEKQYKNEEHMLRQVN